MNFDEQVFKANDIRGAYPDSIDESFAWLLGKGIATELGAENVVVGRDCRLSSPQLTGAVHAGLTDGGVEVGVVGLCPSELIYYIMGSSEKYDLAVIVTASHNPPGFNGFKLVGTGGAPVTSADALGTLQGWMRSADHPEFCGASEPEQNVFAEQEYIDYALGEARGRHDLDRLKVVVDPGNGTGGILWDDLSEAIGLQPVRMNFEPNGHFPAHMPNPAKKENLEPLIQRVMDEKADVGFAYDGDADRTVAVLSDGHVLGGSEMIAALVEHLFEGAPSSLSAVSMTTSRKVLDFLRHKGRDPVIVPVGHSKVKRIMRSRDDIDFAGEESGHYFYREFFCCESSLITTQHLLQLTAEGKLEDLPDKLAGPWIGPDPEPAFPFARQDEALEACRLAAREALKRYPNPREIMCEYTWDIERQCKPDDIDTATGVRADYEDWWFAVRPSGTEPLARLTGEARTSADLREKLRVIGEFFPRGGEKARD